MERTTVEEAKLIFKDNFIGPKELSNFFRQISPSLLSEINVPEIPWSKTSLQKLSDNYILILGQPSYGNIDITIRNLRNVYGIDSDVSEPCFYNQDWYLKEDFINIPLDQRWYLVRKDTFDNTRAIDPALLIEHNVKFPPAILCCYTFFAYWSAYNKILWKYDFVWCQDTDHNGDRIYVGKYCDIDAVNKNGFSIHRHLALRNCYTAIDYLS